MEFKQEIPTLAERLAEAERILKCHPNKVPILLESANSAQKLDQNKFLVPKNYTFQEFIFHVRKRLRLNRMNSLYITVGNHIPTMDKKIGQLYSDWCEDDKFLYVKYSTEAALG